MEGRLLENIDSETAGGRERRGRLRTVAAAVLSLIGASTSVPDLLHGFVNLLVDRAGFDAVALRIRQGDDYPFLLHRGLDEEFVRQESSLLAKDEDRAPGRLLNCLCGAVIESRIDSLGLHASAHGSLWVNDFPALMEGRPDLEPMVRGRCVEAGFRSQAFIPLRAGGETFGMLLIADRRPGMFAHGPDTLLDLVAGLLSLSLAQHQSNERMRAEAEERERTAVALRESEARFRLLLQHIPTVSVQGYGPDGTVRYWNAASEHVYGYTAEEALGRNLVDLIIPPEMREEVRQAVRSMTESGQPIPTMELQLMRKDGSLVPVLSSHAVVNVQGVGPELYCMDFDLTELKRAEETLRDSEKKLQTILNNVPAVVYLKDRQGRYQFVNSAWQEAVGVRAEYVLGKTANEVFPKVVADTLMRADEDVLGSREAVEMEQMVPLQEGTCTFLVRETALHDASGDAYAICGFGTDITERKRAEKGLGLRLEKLTETQATLSMAMQMAEIGPWEYDVATGMFTFNDQFYSLYATTSEREGGCGMSEATYAREFLFPEDSSLVAREIEAALAPGAPHTLMELEHRMRRRDGAIRTVLVRYLVVRDEAGQPIRNIGFNQDITRRKRTEEQLLAAKKAAETANLAKSTFLATMSHEIRTPMNGILGMLQLLRTTSLDREQGDYVDLALHSSRNLLHILSDILDLSRIEAGAMALQEEAFGIDALVKPVIGALRIEAGNKGLDLSVEVDRCLPACLRGDPGRIRQVLFNLVGNAIKYTEQGQIRLELYQLPYGRKPGFISLHMAVADTGIGIADNHLRMVFEPFTQADGSYTRRQGGAGLGLSIVKRLVGLMGGTMAVCSEPGQGTEVHVTLQLRPVEAATAALVSQSRKSSAMPTRVLVVEDEAINRLAVVNTLQKLGYEVGQAANGQEALDLLAGEDFDVVLMDIQMPVMSGLEATRRIRASEAGPIDPRIPIVALTACAMASDRERFLAAGMDDYIVKPIDFQDLERIMAGIRAG